MEKLEALLRDAKLWWADSKRSGRTIEAAAAQIRIKAIEDCIKALKATSS